jgi:hypothetical protein
MPDIDLPWFDQRWRLVCTTARVSLFSERRIEVEGDVPKDEADQDHDEEHLWEPRPNPSY